MSMIVCEGRAGTKQGHISLPMDQKPAFRLYTLVGSFGLSKVRYALIGMVAPRPVIKHGATKQKIG